MHLVTSEQMARIDRRSIDEHGIPGYTLMQCAGKAVVDEIVARSGSVVADKVIVLCGSGNNGGDGFVVARLLRDLKAEVHCHLVAGDPSKVFGDARKALDDWQESGGETGFLADDEAVREAARGWTDADYVVDGLLGTGLSGEVRGVAKTAIEEVGSLRVPVIAIDIPSGVSGSTGEVLGAAIGASLTVTFGLPKIGHAFYPGKKRCGTLVVADIGFPAEAVEAEAGNIQLTGRDDARGWLPRREPDAHKGTAGRVLVVAGSVGLTGAAALASEAALRAGCGLATLACPASLNDVLEGMLREVMTKPLPEVRPKRCLATRALGELRRLAADADVVAVGPGLGRHHETVELVQRFVRELDRPVVIDADGLFALADAIIKRGERPAGLFSQGQYAVLTPHYGECARLLGVETEEVASRPLDACRETAGRFGTTVLLKGNPTVVCGPAGEAWVNTSGNAGMATGGSGDALTGVVAGLMAQGIPTETAARLGAYVHGAAGDLARDELGLHGMIAGDIQRMIPPAMKHLAEGE